MHSYGGRRYLYPAPARFVNHSDDPSCVEDFDRCCDVALTDIAKGEPITIDATRETARELATFLDALNEALEARSVSLLGALVDGAASLWRRGDGVRGRDEVVAALLAPEPKPLSGVEWFVGTGRWVAVCSAEADIDDRRQHVTIVVKVVLGNWQVVYQHVG